tara:strand:- start:264 stop:440 length:177 start_codon:yes stop_codon:yes gene_type:complete
MQGSMVAAMASPAEDDVEGLEVRSVEAGSERSAPISVGSPDPPAHAMKRSRAAMEVMC